MWDGEKGAAKADVLKTALESFDKAEARRASIPAKADDYKLELPKDFKLPEGAELDPNHPLLGPAREYAKAHDLTQDEFSELVALDAKRLIEFQAAQKTALAKEKEALGPKADERIATAQKWIESVVPSPEHAKAVMAAMGSAKAIEGVEAMMKAAVGGNVDAFRSAGTAPPADPNAVPENWDRMSFAEQSAWSRRQRDQRAA